MIAHIKSLYLLVRYISYVLILVIYKCQYYSVFVKLTVVHFMDLKCGKLIVNMCVCTSWNKCVRRILNLPHDVDSWLLGPLLKQNHIKKQFIVRTLRFLFCMLKSHNGIVEVCILNANSPMGSNLSFLRSKYGINFHIALKWPLQ